MKVVEFNYVLFELLLPFQSNFSFNKITKSSDIIKFFVLQKKLSVIKILNSICIEYYIIYIFKSFITLSFLF
jgi:hypothetical protein